MNNQTESDQLREARELTKSQPEDPSFLDYAVVLSGKIDRIRASGNISPLTTDAMIYSLQLVLHGDGKGDPKAFTAAAMILAAVALEASTGSNLTLEEIIRL